MFLFLKHFSYYSRLALPEIILCYLLYICESSAVVLIGIMLNLYIVLLKINIATTLRFQILDHSISLHWTRSSISFITISSFEYTDPIPIFLDMCVCACFILLYGALLFFTSSCWYIVHRKMTDICVLTYYPLTLLSSLIRFRSVFCSFLGFIHRQSCHRRIGRISFLCASLYAFSFFFLPFSMVRNSMLLNMIIENGHSWFVLISGGKHCLSALRVFCVFFFFVYTLYHL